MIKTRVDGTIVKVSFQEGQDVISLAPSQGVGAALRHSLGVSIVGGLLVSQWLTLYTMPVVYLYLGRLSQWLTTRRSRARTRPTSKSPVSLAAR